MNIELLNIENKSELRLLLQKAMPVALPLGQNVMDIVDKLIKTLKRKGGGAGLAAPQIGINQRIMICSYNRKIDDIKIIINPEYRPINSEQEDDWEGCFSVPFTFAMMKRWKNIEVSYFNLQGNKINHSLENNAARIFQHEYDHLEGNLIIHQSKELKTFKNKDEYKEFIKSYLAAQNAVSKHNKINGDQSAF